jgi:hypothetical protein
VYSESVIAQLHLVARAIEAGFRPSEVVTLGAGELTKLVEAAEAEAFAVRAGAGSRAVARAVASTSGSTSTSTSTSVDAILEALRADDVVAMRARMRAAAVALGPRAFVAEVAHPLAVRNGELWAEGVIDVRHEHLASACLTSQLQLLLGALDDGERSPAVLLATLPAEPHLLGVDMVAVYLAASLAAPRVLGADARAQQNVDAARALRVDAVGISISPVADVRASTRAVRVLASALPGGVELWLGGGGARAAAKGASSARVIATWPELDAALTALRANVADR